MRIVNDNTVLRSVVRRTVLISAFVLIIFPLLAQTRNEALGPLVGRNLQILHLPFLSISGHPALVQEPGLVRATVGLTVANDFLARTYGDDIEGETYLDYEITEFDLGLRFSPGARTEIGVDLRLDDLSGGFMDALIDAFHESLGFTAFNFDGGRRFFVERRNELNLDIETTNGGTIAWNRGATLAFGAIDLRFKRQWIAERTLRLSTEGAVRLPTGLIENEIRQTMGTDLGAFVLLDWHPVSRFSAFIQSGLTVPLETIMPQSDTRPYPLGTAFAALEFRPWAGFALVAQINIQNSAYRDAEPGGYNFSLPQIDIVFGFRRRIGPWIGQFSVEENPISEGGADIAFGFRLVRELAVNSRP